MPISQHSLDFLTENRFEDSLDWFHAHKREYEALVLAPLAELVEELAPVMRGIDSRLIVEPRVDRCISRIYRDTRFSKDKFRYRDVMWIVFLRDKKLYYGPPTFFFEFSPRGFRYGCGWYQAQPKTMEMLRGMIVENAAPFRKARKAVENQTLFGMEGEAYKRSRFPGQPPALRAWLDRKNLCFIHNSTDFEVLFSPELGTTLAEGFGLLAPVYHFFRAAEDRARA